MEVEKKKVISVLDSLPKTPIPNLNDKYLEILSYISKHSEIIMSKSILLCSHLSDIRVNTQIKETIIQIIYQALKSSPNCFDYLLQVHNVFNVLFPLCSLSSSKISIVLLLIFLHNPQLFTDYVDQNPNSIDPLIFATASQSIDSGELLLRIFCATHSIMSVLTPKIITRVKDFPAKCAIGMMLTSAEIQKVIPISDFVDWILSKPFITIFDIKSSCMLYPELWNESSILLCLSKTSPPENFDSIQWICEKPQELFDIAHQECEIISSSMLYNKFHNTSIDYMEGFLFVRIYLLSQCNPTDVPQDVFALLSKVLFHENLVVSLSVVQLMIIWSLRFNYIVSNYHIFSISKYACDDSKPEYYREICIYALECFSNNQELALHISQTLGQTNMEIVHSYKWLFPHFSKFTNTFKTSNKYSKNDILQALGALLNAIEEKNDIQEI